MSNDIRTFAQAGNGIAFGAPISGDYAQAMPVFVSTIALPCTDAGAVSGVATRERHVDVATKRNQGTLVWSPPS